jgi:B12-binding domain/radical SAM domain protein
LQILFRQTRSNRYTLPVLLNLAEAWDPEGRVKLGVVRSVEDAAAALASGEPTFLGYSFMTTHLEEVIQEVALLRPRMGPGDLLAAGGSHPTADPEGTLALGFGTVAVGEAEETFPRLLDRWSKPGLPGGVPPVWRPSSPCALERALPISLRENFMAPLEITRGCSHSCAYCFTPRIHGAPVRHRTMVSIERYLEHSHVAGRSLARFVSPDAFSYRDPAGGSPLESLERVLRLSREKGLRQVHLGDYPSEVRPDHIHDDFLALVHRYCTNRKLVIGAQSGSDRLLRAIRRGHTVRHVLTGVERVVESGLSAHVDMIFGLPGESAEDRLESLRLMERLIALGRTRIHAHMYLPLPGTPLFRLPPPLVEPWFLEKVRQLQGDGELDGEWEKQAVLQGKILEWRASGLIRV